MILLQLLYFQFILLYMCECFVYIYVLHIYVEAWCPLSSKEGVGSLGTSVVDGCELGFWELNGFSVRATSALNH